MIRLVGGLAAGLLVALGTAVSADPGTHPDARLRERNAPVPRISGPAQDYARNCQGCHGAQGYSVDEIPVLKDRVGYFVHTPEGRAYLLQVPNVAQAHLPDERLAALMNWLLQTYSAAQLPPDFSPYTPGEVREARATHLERVIPLRKRIVEELAARGVIATPDVLAFRNE